MDVHAKDIMSSPVTVLHPGMSLAEAARILTEDGISGAPVVSLEGQLRGIVSRTDIINRCLEGRISSGVGDSFLFFVGLGEAVLSEEMKADVEALGTIDDIMEQDAIVLRPDTPLSEVAAAMNQSHIHRVLVVEKGGVGGIITALDLIENWPRS